MEKRPDALIEIALRALRQTRKSLFGRIPEGDLVVAFRNVLAHGYATLDHRRVYGIATTRVSELTSVLEKMLAQMPEDPTASRAETRRADCGGRVPVRGGVPPVTRIGC